MNAAARAGKDNECQEQLQGSAGTSEPLGSVRLDIVTPAQDRECHLLTPVHACLSHKKLSGVGLSGCWPSEITMRHSWAQLW
jgi:hypothetical protein